MIPLSDVQVETIVSAMVARLDEAVPNTTIYLRRVGHVLGQPDDVPPPTVSDTDRRVKPYVVVYPSPGVAGPDRRLGTLQHGRVFAAQTTLVAGDETALDILVRHVESALHDWRPQLGRADVGRVRPAGFDPGVSLRDDDVTPPRFWVPLQWRIPIYN